MFTNFFLNLRKCYAQNWSPVQHGTITPARGHVIDRRHFTKEITVARLQVICNEVMKVNVKCKKNVNAFFIVEVHLAIKLVYRNSTVNKVKVTIQT